MRVAFLHLDLRGQESCRTLAEIMVKSVRAAMPAVEIVQMTDTKTLPIAGVDTVTRLKLPYPWLMQFRLEHFRQQAPDVLFLDTDIIMLRDPREAFTDCDIALTQRTGPIYLDGKDIVQDMPFNTGVMYSNNVSFWDECFKHSWELSEGLKHWFGDQMAVKAIAQSDRFNVKYLTCDEYNYSPSHVDEDLSGKYIAHMKGERKKFMPTIAKRMGLI